MLFDHTPLLCSLTTGAYRRRKRGTEQSYFFVMVWNKCFFCICGTKKTACGVTVCIKNKKSTNFDIYFQIAVGSVLLGISLFMTILFFYIPTDNLIKAFFYMFSYTGITVFGIILLTSSLSNKSFLKRMKAKYDGCQL